MDTTGQPAIETKFVLHGQGWAGLGKVDFDRKEIRKGMREIGKLIQKASQSLVSGNPKYPVRRTGTLQKNIKYHVSRPGFYVKIRPEKGNMDAFYPAYLYYGVRRKGGGGGGWRIEPRDNYPVDALEANHARVRQMLEAAFWAALK